MNPQIITPSEITITQKTHILYFHLYENLEQVRINFDGIKLEQWSQWAVKAGIDLEKNMRESTTVMIMFSVFIWVLITQVYEFLKISQSRLKICVFHCMYVLPGNLLTNSPLSSLLKFLGILCLGQNLAKSPNVGLYSLKSTWCRSWSYVGIQWPSGINHFWIAHFAKIICLEHLKWRGSWNLSIIL